MRYSTIQNQQGKLKCLLCRKRFNHLGSHLWHKHKMFSRTYKEKFGLPYQMPLISDEIHFKKKLRFEENKELYLKNLTRQFCFKKGHSGIRRISQHEREKIIKRIISINKNNKTKLTQCPVCKMKFNHMESHLYNKHGLLVAIKSKN